MSTKVKLVSLISAFVFVLAIMMVAVMAVPTVTLNIGGNISFTATDLQVTISQGVLANGTIEDSANKMQEVKIDAYDDGTEELATWTNLELTFDESGEDMTITFIITNNSTIDDIRATVTVDQGTTNNATVSVTTPSSSSVRIPANDGSQQFVVTFHIDNRNDSASIENFEISIDLEKYEPQVYDYFDFDVNSDGTTVTLTDYDSSLSGTTDIVIPSTVSQNESGQWTEGDTYTVTDILSAALGIYGVFYNSGITSIEFPSTLETIGNYAFYGCSGLTSVSLPSGLTSIGNAAFQNCSGLTSITLPSSLNIIGNGAFNRCSGLETLEYKGTVEQWLSIEFDSDWMTDSSHTFIADGEELTNLVVPEGVTSIGERAFYGCSGLTELDLSNCTSLTSIGSSAFYGCSGLTSITLPSSLTSIGFNAFRDCSGLETLEYKGTVEQWLSIEFDSDWMTDSSHTFIADGEELTNLVVPEGVTSIGERAFYGCSGLTELDLSNCTSLTSIESYAFYGCNGLTSIILPSSLTNIGDYAFSYCLGLNTLEYKGTLEQWLSINFGSSWMGDTSHTFIVNGEELTNLVVPEGVTSIGDYAFYGCSGLTELDLSNCTSLTSIESYAFWCCSGLTSIDLPSSLTSIGNYAFNGCRGLTSITLPSSLEAIGGSAFSDCRGLTEVDLSNCTSLTSIESYAFYGCSGLTSITLPSSLKNIGEYAFQDCTSLTKVDLSNCISLEGIGDNAFEGCSGLTSVTINQYVFENVTSSTSCGYILGYIDSGETVLVPANLIDDLGLTNSYLDGSSFTRSATAVDGYYVYTKI